MPVRCLRILSAAIAMFALVFPATADETSNKQKAAAIRNLKLVGLDKMTTVESPNFIVCSSLPEPRAKALADQLEKVAATAKKALVFEPNEEPWKGKLTVYLLDTGNPYRMFLLQVAKDRSRDPYYIAIRSEEPYIAKRIEDAKTPEAETFADTGKLVAAALIAAKAGGTTPLPDWVRFGFGRAAVARAAGQGSRALNDLKAKSRAAVNARPPAKVDDAWTTENPVVDASVMDYIAFGPTAAMNFGRFITAFRPAENGDAPGIDQVLMTMMWSRDDLDKAWKKYVLTGR